MWHYYVITVFAIYCGSVYAKTEQDLKLELVQLVMQCNNNSEVDMLEMAKLQSYVTPTNPKTKCVLACAYRAAKVMTPDGLYNLEHAYEVAEMVKNGDEKRLANGRKMADNCVKVNDVQVSDGTKGCERAALIFKCTIDNAAKYGFKL